MGGGLFWWGLKYSFQGINNAKNLWKIVFYLLTGGYSMLPLASPGTTSTCWGCFPSMLCLHFFSIDLAQILFCILSFVRSVTMDKWKDAEVEKMKVLHLVALQSILSQLFLHTLGHRPCCLNPWVLPHHLSWLTTVLYFSTETSGEPKQVVSWFSLSIVSVLKCIWKV